MTVDFEIYMYPREGIDYDQNILGISLLERCAAIVAGIFNRDKIFAPFLEENKNFRGIEISTEFPDFSKNILLIDPAFLCDKKLLNNMVNNFKPTVVACDSSSLTPLGLAYVKRDDIDDEFHKAPWFKIERLISENKGNRVAVIDGRYFYVRNNSSAKEASSFILQNLRLKSDSILTANIYRPFSLMFTKAVSFLSFSPDVLSVLAIVASLFSAIFFVSGGYFNTLTAAVILQFAFLFCNMDGEHARLKYLKTEHGKWLNASANTAVILLPITGLAFSLADGILLRSALIFIGFFVANSIAAYLYAYKTGQFIPESFFLDNFIKESRNGYFKIFLQVIGILMKRDSFIFFLFVFSILGLTRILIPIYAFAMVFIALLSFAYYIGRLKK